MDHLKPSNSRRKFLKDTLKLTAGTIMKMKKIFFVFAAVHLFFSINEWTNQFN